MATRDTRPQPGEMWIHPHAARALIVQGYDEKQHLVEVDGKVMRMPAHGSKAMLRSEGWTRAATPEQEARFAPLRDHYVRRVASERVLEGTRAVVKACKALGEPALAQLAAAGTRLAHDQDLGVAVALVPFDGAPVRSGTLTVSSMFANSVSLSLGAGHNAAYLGSVRVPGEQYGQDFDPREGFVVPAERASQLKVLAAPEHEWMGPSVARMAQALGATDFDYDPAKGARGLGTLSFAGGARVEMEINGGDEIDLRYRSAAGEVLAHKRDLNIGDGLYALESQLAQTLVAGERIEQLRGRAVELERPARSRGPAR